MNVKQTFTILDLAGLLKYLLIRINELQAKQIHIIEKIISIYPKGGKDLRYYMKGNVALFYGNINYQISETILPSTEGYTEDNEPKKIMCYEVNTDSDQVIVYSSKSIITNTFVLYYLFHDNEGSRFRTGFILNQHAIDCGVKIKDLKKFARYSIIIKHIREAISTIVRALNLKLIHPECERLTIHPTNDFIVKRKTSHTYNVGISARFYTLFSSNKGKKSISQEVLDQILKLIRDSILKHKIRFYWKIVENFQF